MTDRVRVGPDKRSPDNTVRKRTRQPKRTRHTVKKLLIGLAALLAVAAPVTLAATPAQADAGSRPSVTRAEPRHLHKSLNNTVAHRRYVEHVTRSEFNHALPGMTAIQITWLFDIPGKMTYQGGGYQTRQFLGWKSGDGERYVVEVDFRIGPDARWHVANKWAHLPSYYGYDRRAL